MRTYSWFFLAAFLACSSVSYAQSDNPTGGHFGVKAGVSLTRLNISGISPNIPKQKLDPHLGVMYRYRLHKFVIQPEVLLAAKGGTMQVQRIGATTRETIRNNYYYLSVPLLLGYIPTEGITLQAGPEFSYALNAGKSGGPGAKNDLGLVVGAHYDFLDMLDKFSLHVRYVYGFTNVSPEPLAVYKNRVLQASIVYNLYPKQKK
ncbi:PorT family protein [Spirosoma taeanense]|uniref:PorT family protein n=1 Tax=Spirosoma taeanense TaxID=2735870 RepID=A0A6M5Y3H3_9BACT|nr:porin family protein [Spirosoma taeanense]QJW88275.1 PorT family protein [Spirosoma taeanense]